MRACLVCILKHVHTTPPTPNAASSAATAATPSCAAAAAAASEIVARSEHFAREHVGEADDRGIQRAVGSGGAYERELPPRGTGSVMIGHTRNERHHSARRCAALNAQRAAAVHTRQRVD
jgi:hypothetical protein